jgi:hypothetical protein
MKVMTLVSAATIAAALCGSVSTARAQTLPFLGEEARKRGIELPKPFGIGVVYYYLDREIAISDVRVGRNGETPSSVSDFAQLGSSSRVNNANIKFDVWLLPFLNVYAIAGHIWNESTTRIDVTLPPILPGGSRGSMSSSCPRRSRARSADWGSRWPADTARSSSRPTSTALARISDSTIGSRWS